MTGLYQQLNDDVKAAMRAGNAAERDTIRLALAAIKQHQVDNQTLDQTPDDALVLALLAKMISQRDESIAQFAKGGRDDLIATEDAEKVILQRYLPEQLSDEEVDQTIDAAIAEHNAESLRDMGAVMRTLKEQLAGRANMGLVGPKVKQRLS